MRPPDGVNLSALPTRFCITCTILARSSSAPGPSGSVRTSSVTPRRTARSRISATVLGDDVVERGGRALQRHLAGVDARELEHGVDQRLHLAAGGADDVRRLLHLAVGLFVFDELGAQRDDGQRLLEIVHEHGRLIALERLELAARGGELEERADAGAQLGGADRLLQILFGAELEAGADRFGVDAVAGHEDDGDVAMRRRRAGGAASRSRRGRASTRRAGSATAGGRSTACRQLAPSEASRTR